MCCLRLVSPILLANCVTPKLRRFGGAYFLEEVSVWRSCCTDPQLRSAQENAITRCGKAEAICAVQCTGRTLNAR